MAGGISTFLVIICYGNRIFGTLYRQRIQLLFAELLIKVWVICVEVFLVKIILDQTETFTETLKVYQFTLAEEADGIGNFCILCQTQDVIIGSAGFLLCRHIFCQIRNRVTGTLEGSGAKWGAACRLRPETDGVIDIVVCESLLLQFFCRQISRKLVDNGTYHFHVVQFFGTDIGTGIAPTSNVSDWLVKEKNKKIQKNKTFLQLTLSDR